MGRDRSLDEFLNGSDAEGETGADDTGEGATAAEAEEPSATSESVGDDDGRAVETTGEETDESGDAEFVAADAADPAVATYRFDPAGATCEACGESVQRRWYDDGTYVCRDCKSWERDAERATPR